MKFIFTLLIAAITSGCSHTEQTKSEHIVNVHTQMNNAPKDSIHSHVTRIGNKLFSTSQDLNLDQGVAVGTFLPLDKLSGKTLPTDTTFGHQLQESFVTLGAQAGLNVIEYKATTAVKFQENYDVMLSRNVKEVKNKMNANYYLTGTYTEQEDSFIVNARLIDIKTQYVVAAATDFIPVNVMFAERKISTKHNMIHRKTY